MKRLLIYLGRALGERQHILLAGLVVMFLHLHSGRSCLAVPVFKLSEIASICISHCRQEILAGNRLAIMALEIQIHTFSKAINAKQGLVHTHHFCALLIYRDGIEIIDLLILIWANRMGHGTCVLRELQLTQSTHVLNALHRSARLTTHLIG